MPRTRLGVTAGLLAASVYFAAILGGYLPVIILGGYILLFEQDAFLRRCAVKSATFLFAYGVLVTIIGLVPDFLSWVNSGASIINVSSVPYIVTEIINLLTSALSIIKVILFLFLGINALKGKDIAIPFVDGFLKKYM